jgi:hypothetical protein
LALAGVLAFASPGVDAHQGIPAGASVGEVTWADPAPAGISYEWTVLLAKKQKAELVNFVGAKSWNEPSNPEGGKGWTHTSNWIALRLDEPAVVKITVTRQQGVVNATSGTPSVTRSALVPALSLYEGRDDTTENEVHTYNTVGNFWATVEYLASAANEKGKTSVTLKRKLPAGDYSIAVGGNPPSLGGPSAYPPNDCDPVDPTCYQYTGLQGYRVTIQAK